jgi:hypothetical protein
VNYYYSGAAAMVSRGGELDAPLTNFQTAFGRRFDPVSDAVNRVDVRATVGDGETVTLNWPQDNAPEKRSH